MAGEAKSEENPVWNLSHRILVMATMLVSLTCLYSSLGTWYRHIGKAYWHRGGHIHHKSIGGNPQNELQSSQEGYDISPQPLHSSNFKSSPPDHFCLVLLTTCISNIFLVGRATLAPFEQAGEEAGMCEGVEREANRWMHSEPFLASVKALLSTLPCVHKIPLSTNLGSSIKRFENFKYQKICLEVKFQSFYCIWSVCMEKKCHGKGQTICRVSLEDEQKAEDTQPTLQKRSH